MDEDFFRARAILIRDMADKADPFTKKRLRRLAQEYEAKFNIPLSDFESLSELDLVSPLIAGKAASVESKIFIRSESNNQKARDLP